MTGKGLRGGGGYIYILYMKQCELKLGFEDLLCNGLDVFLGMQNNKKRESIQIILVGSALDGTQESFLNISYCDKKNRQFTFHKHNNILLAPRKSRIFCTNTNN